MKQVAVCDRPPAAVAPLYIPAAARGAEARGGAGRKGAKDATAAPAGQGGKRATAVPPKVEKAHAERPGMVANPYTSPYTRLSVTVDEKTQRIITRLVDQRTGKVLSEIPSQRALRVLAGIQAMIGRILDRRA